MNASDERRKVRGVEWGCGGVRGVWTVEFGVISEGRVVRDEGRGVHSGRDRGAI